MSVAARSRNGALVGEADERPDLTSMIDVVFLLLIFFLCTLQFRVLQGQLPTHLPKDLGGSPAVLAALNLPLELSLVRDAGGARVRLGPAGLSPVGPGGGDWVGVGGVEDRVAAARAVDPELAVLIQAGAGVLHDDVVRVVDGCLSAGVRRITFGRGE